MESWFPTFRRLFHWEVPLPVIWPGMATPAQRHALLRLIALSIEENVPLRTLVQAWAEDERGQQRLRLNKLAELLDSGRPVADAVEEIPGILGDEELLAIRFDAQMGTRTTAIRQMLNGRQSEVVGAKGPVRGDLFYFFVMLFIGLLHIAFLQIKIVPVFRKMFQEFSYEQPQVLGWSVRITSALASLWWLWAIAILAVLWCMFSTQAGRFLQHSILGRWLKPLRERYAADVLQKLAVAAGAGRPISGALSTLARYHFVPDVRHKLLFVRNEVELGAEVWHSMVAVDLLSPSDLRLLKTAERVGNRAWVLQQLAAVKEGRTRQRLERASQFVLPVVVLLLGCLVIFQALTIFVPLLKLIEGNL
jgi:type II secretory pathway component PulF